MGYCFGTERCCVLTLCVCFRLKSLESRLQFEVNFHSSKKETINIDKRAATEWNQILICCSICASNTTMTSSPLSQAPLPTPLRSIIIHPLPTLSRTGAARRGSRPRPPSHSDQFTRKGAAATQQPTSSFRLPPYVRHTTSSAVCSRRRTFWAAEKG